MPSICQGTWDCQICPKAVSNAITHVIYRRGFHKPAQKCEENLILFLMKGEILVNSKEYAGATEFGTRTEMKNLNSFKTASILNFH